MTARFSPSDLFLLNVGISYVYFITRPYSDHDIWSKIGYKQTFNEVSSDRNGNILVWFTGFYLTWLYIILVFVFRPYSENCSLEMSEWYSQEPYTLFCTPSSGDLLASWLSAACEERGLYQKRVRHFSLSPASASMDTIHLLSTLLLRSDHFL